jgi:DNA polymerase-3 subunit delta'
MALRDIIGHHKQKNILKGLIRNKRLPSSLLFKGEAGIGKRLTAINFAKVINCLKPNDNDCCDHCISCRKIDSKVHPDVFYLEQGEVEITIDQIRALEDFIFLKPSEGNKRVVIIDNSHQMNVNAQNAFLKTLEEPPPDCILILITSSPDKMLDTIRSRCFQIGFTPLPKEKFRAFIERQELTTDKGLLELCSGCIGSLLSGELKVRVESFYQYLDEMHRGEVKERWADNQEVQAWFNLALVYLRDRLLYTLMGAEAQPLLHTPTETVSIEEAIEAYEKMLSIVMDLDNNLNKKILWNLSKEVVKCDRN